ncbi:MAG: hypothetical protein K0R43_3527 [Pseudoduganella sp.]|jgi:hypothetical protein|nr:hypothetical protein [Pseudoduganella sp.]
MKTAGRAIDEAGKQDASEENLKAWTTALLRSEAQQAHCYRY